MRRCLPGIGGCSVFVRDLRRRKSWRVREDCAAIGLLFALLSAWAGASDAPPAPDCEFKADHSGPAHAVLLTASVDPDTACVIVTAVRRLLADGETISSLRDLSGMFDWMPGEDRPRGRFAVTTRMQGGGGGRIITVEAGGDTFVTHPCGQWYH